MKLDEHKSQWVYRRWTIFATLAFCAYVITYVMVWYGEPDSRVAETLVTMSFGTASAVVLGYVFGAVIDDKNVVTKIMDARAQSIVDRANPPQQPPVMPGQDFMAG